MNPVLLGESGLNRIAARGCRRGEGSEPDGPHHIGHDAKIEDEQMHGDEWHNKAVLMSEADDHWCQK